MQQKCCFCKSSIDSFMHVTTDFSFTFTTFSSFSLFFHNFPFLIFILLIKKEEFEKPETRIKVFNYKKIQPFDLPKLIRCGYTSLK